jgi:hypothetical protein
MKLHKVLVTEESLNEFRYFNTKKVMNEVNRSEVTSSELLRTDEVCIKQKKSRKYGN